MTTAISPQTVRQPSAVERVHAHHDVVRRLGNWTTAGRIEARVRGGLAVLDLRSPDLPAQVEIRLDLDHGTLKLLVAEDAVLDCWDLRWTGKGRVKDAEGGRAAHAGRRIRLVGTAVDGEVRVRRGGVALLSAMCTREYLRDALAARRAGGFPTIDDPTRTR